MMIRRFLTIATLITAHTLAAAQTVSGQREISSLTVFYSTSNTPQVQADISLSLGGESVDHFVLTYSKPLHHFSVAFDSIKAEGSIGLVIAASPDPSHIDGFFSIHTQKNPSFQFQGSVVSWNVPDTAVLAQMDYNLTSSVLARTRIRNGSRHGAEVAFIDAGQQIFTAFLLPPSPVAVVPADLIVGSDTINSGAQFVLTPPSGLANGQVFLSCTFSSATAPPTNFAADIAIWPLGSKDERSVRASGQVGPLSSPVRRVRRLVRVPALPAGRQSERADPASSRADRL